MKHDVFFLILWLVIGFVFDAVTYVKDWAIGIVTGGFAVSIFYRLVLRSPKARKFFND